MIFSIFLSYNFPAGTLSSALRFCQKFLFIYWQALFQSTQHLYEKREGSGSGSISLTNGSGSIREAKKHADPDPDPQHW
jgi:hypothetical protein